MKQRLIDRKYGFYSAIIVMSLAIMIYTLANRLIGGDYLFMHSDLLVQYGTFAKLLLRNLFEGGSVEYSFQISMGMPTVALYTFYSFNPFNLIYGIIENMDTASAVIVICKLTLAGYTFQRFLKKVFHIDKIESVMFAVLYALCGYSVVFYYNIHTLDGVYMLPVIISLIVTFVQKGKCLRLLWAYAYLFVVNFYCGYIIGFFSALIWLILMIQTYKKEWGKYIVYSVKYVGVVVFAALLGAFALWPTARYVFEANGGQGVFGGLKINILDMLNAFFVGGQLEIEYHPVLYCGLLTLLLIPCFYINREIDKKIKVVATILLGYLLVCSLWTPGYLFMHCFDVPNGCGYRYAYFFAFTLISMGALAWEKFDIEKWNIIAVETLGLCIFYVLFYFVQNKFYSEENIISSAQGIYYNFLFFVGYVLILFLAKKKESLKRYLTEILLLWVCIEVVVNGVIEVKNLGGGSAEEHVVNQAFVQLSNGVIDEIKAQDAGVYRIYYENIFGTNDAALNDYMALDYFSTIENVNYRNTLRRLGYYTSPRLAYDYGSTPVTRMLFGEKYHINVNRREYVLTDDIPSWEEELALSFGYMVSSDILDVNLEDESAFVNQNRLVSAMVGKRVEVFSPYQGPIICATENCVLSWDGNWNIVERVEDSVPEATLTMIMDESLDIPAYAYFAQEESFRNYLSPQVVSKGGDMGTLMNLSFLSVPHILMLGKNEQGKYAATIYIIESTLPSYGFQNVYFAYYNETAEQELYDALKDHQLTIQRMKGNRLEGTVESTEEKNILFLSIPYDRGWHIYVDGVENDIISAVNDTFLAVELQPGYHHIEMEYRDEAFRLGRWISLFTLIAVLICGVISTLSKREEKVG